MTNARHRAMRMARALTLSASFLAALCCLCLVGCNSAEKTQAQALAKRGTEQGDKLADYYTRLADAAQRTQDLQALRQAVLLNAASPNAGSQQADPAAVLVRGLRDRAAMAKQLSTVCVTLSKLAGDEPAGDISGEFGKLEAAMIKVNGSKKFLGATPASALSSGLLDKAIDGLVSLIQIRDFHMNDPRLLQIISGIEDVYEYEKPLYVLTAQSYEQARKGAADLFADRHRILLGTEFVDDVAPYGSLLQTAGEDTALNKWAKRRRASILADRMKQAEKDVDTHSESLYKLLRTAQGWSGLAPDYPLFTAASFSTNGIMGMQLYMRTALEARSIFAKNHPDAAVPYKPSDPLSDYLAMRLSEDERKLLVDHEQPLNSSAAQAAFLSEINRVLEASDLCGFVLSSLPDDLNAHIDQFRANPTKEARDKLQNETLGAINVLLFKGRTNTAAQGGLSLGESRHYVLFIAAKHDPVRTADQTGLMAVVSRRVLLERAYPVEMVRSRLETRYRDWGGKPK